METVEYSLNESVELTLVLVSQKVELDHMKIYFT